MNKDEIAQIIERRARAMNVRAQNRLLSMDERLVNARIAEAFFGLATEFRGIVVMGT